MGSALRGGVAPGARHASAAGFQIHERSARAMAGVFVGEAAAAEDPTTLFDNPARF